jgi:hypothetical protein
MWRLIKNVRLARWWDGALTATSRSEYENALHYLNLMEGVGVDADGGAISRYGIFYRVLRGFVLISLNRRKEAGGVLMEAARQLNSIRNPSDEIKYLICYVNILMQSVNIDQNCLDREHLSTFNYEEVDLAKVPAHVKSKFPLRYHPKWKETSR